MPRNSLAVDRMTTKALFAHLKNELREIERHKIRGAPMRPQDYALQRAIAYANELELRGIQLSLMDSGAA